MEINWPELLLGAVLGFGLSLPFFFHERKERKREVGVNWTRDLRSLEPLLFGRDLTWQALYTATSAFPMDHYRRVLGPPDFLALEDLQNALAQTDHPTLSIKAEDHARAMERVQTLRVEIMNIGRRRSSQEYSDLHSYEKWQERRRHPFHAIKLGVKNYFIRHRRKKLGAD